MYKTVIPIEACQKKKQVKSSFESKHIIFTLRLLDLLYIYLFGPTKTYLGEKKYDLVIIDDYIY